MFLRFLFYCILPFFLYATSSGNPALVSLYRCGFVWEEDFPLSLRAQYLADYVYDASFEEEFLSDQTEVSKVTLSTYGTTLTASFFHKVDLYALLGSSKIQFDDELFSSRRFSWGIGSRVLLYKNKGFFLGVEGKFFSTKQRPTYFILEKTTPALIISSFALLYTEIQGSMNLAYQYGPFIPYLGVSYLEAKIAPEPSLGMIDIPSLEMISEFESSSSVNTKKWGVLFGFTLLSSETMSIEVESRFINQNGVTISGEIRF